MKVPFVCKVCSEAVVLSASRTNSVFDADSVYCSNSCLLLDITYRVRSSLDGVMVPKPTFFGSAPLRRRSDLEVLFEMFLIAHKILFVYEPFSVRLESGRRWVPDYVLTQYNLLVECKGVWSRKDHSKVSQAIDVVPDGQDHIIMIGDYLRSRFTKYSKAGPGQPGYNPRMFKLT